MEFRNFTEPFFNGEVDARHVVGLPSCSSPDLPLDEAPDQREEPPPKGALRKSEQ